MKNEIANTRNFSLISRAYSEIISDRGPIKEQIITIVGASGLGKTTLAEKLSSQINGIWIEVESSDTVSQLYAKIANRLEYNVGRIHGEQRTLIKNRLGQLKRPLFVDECNRLIKNEKPAEALREISDQCRIPLVLIGTPDFLSFIESKHPMIFNRVARNVRFVPCDIKDITAIAKTCVELPVTEEVLLGILHKTNGETRSIVIQLEQLERFCRSQKYKTIGINEYETYQDSRK